MTPCFERDRAHESTRELFREFSLVPVLGEKFWNQVQTEPAAAEVLGIQRGKERSCQVCMPARLSMYAISS